MRKDIRTPLIFLFIGLAFSGAAIFANELGLDDHAGWGRVRIATLIFGILLSFVSILGILYKEKINNQLQLIRSFIERQPAAARIRSNRNFINVSRFYKAYRFTFPAFIFVIILYIWLISSGTWVTWVSPTRYYANLARGFENGHLYLPSKVDPILLTLPNPYDPVERDSAGVTAPLDISYLNGRYYLYWGPVPALLLVAISPFTSGRVGDLQLVFTFVSGIFLFQFIMAVMIWDAYFSRLPKWMLLLPILVMGLRSPVLFMLNNSISARIYEAAISGGQFFMVSGLLATLSYFRASSNWKLVLAGSMLMLAIGTRLFLVLPVGFIVLMLALKILKLNLASNQKLLRLISLGAPLAVGVVCLGWYNLARFGSMTESGLYYQFAGVNLREHYHELIGIEYVFQNLYNYLLIPFGINFQFPFLYARVGSMDSVFASYPLPAFYGSQLITGLLYAAPFIVFAFISIWMALLPLFKRKSEDVLRGSDDKHLLDWFIATLLGTVLTAFGFLMVFFWSAMRYAEDFMPSLILLSVIGFWQGYSLLLQKLPARKIYAVSGVVLAGASIIVSAMLAISVNDARFVLIR